MEDINKLTYEFNKVWNIMLNCYPNISMNGELQLNYNNYKLNDIITFIKKYRQEKLYRKDKYDIDVSVYAFTNINDRGGLLYDGIGTSHEYCYVNWTPYEKIGSFHARAFLDRYNKPADMNEYDMFLIKYTAQKYKCPITVISSYIQKHSNFEL